MATKNVSRAQLRLSMLETRSQIGSDKISQLNRDLCKNLSFVWTEAGGLGNPEDKPTWAVYKSFSWEADPTAAIIEASPYIKWAYPKICPDHLLEFFSPPVLDGSANTSPRWLKNSFGIWEPDPVQFKKISLDSCVGVLVPGVAFDRLGHRLGYGKGYYDRALANYRGLKVGVCFSMQMIVEPLPVEVHDVAMDFIVTDKEVLSLRRDVASRLN